MVVVEANFCNHGVRLVQRHVDGDVPDDAGGVSKVTVEKPF